MKQFAKSFLSLALLLALSVVSVRAASCDDCSDISLGNCSPCFDSSVSGTNCGACSSVYIPRPSYNNTAYFWFPWRKDVDCEMNGIAELGFEYQRSFNADKIAQSLFGSSALHFQGSGISASTRDPLALRADDFGLGQFCDTAVSFKPRIQNYNLNFHGRVGFDNWVEGLYGEVYFAFTHQNRFLDLRTSSTLSTCSVNNSCGVASNGSCGVVSNGGCNTSNSCNTSTNNCSVGVMSNNCFVSTSTACTTPFPAGYMDSGVAVTVPNIVQALDGQTLFGDVATPWSFGRFPTCSQTKNAVSGVALVAGWNFWQSDCGHLGAFFQYVAPTGNKFNPQFLFAPVVGNGRHHELGGGISAHYELWNDDCDQALNVYLDGYVMSALRNCQLRSFDFCGKGCLSRYMLLEALNPTTGAYTETLINGINFATRYARVKISVKGDASLRFVYTKGGFNFGIGYNAYGQSRENLYLTNSVVNNCSGNPVLDPTVNYAFKGCATLYTAGTPHSPALTQSNATIKACGTNDPAPVTIQNPVSLGVTNCNPTNCSPSVANCVSSCDGNSNALSNGVLDVHSGETPKQFTNKGFAHLDYTWAECSYAPYLGIGGEAEGGSRFSLNQWGVWIKGGIQF